MIKFEVTGSTPEEFAKNALQAFGLLAIGLQKVAAASTDAPASPEPATATPPSASARPGQQQSSAQTTTTSSEMFDKLDTLLDTPAMEPLENPKLGTSGPKGAKPPKLEDLKAALAKVITAAAERGWDMPRSRAYATQLLAYFGAKKLSD